MMGSGERYARLACDAESRQARRHSYTAYVTLGPVFTRPAGRRGLSGFQSMHDGARPLLACPEDRPPYSILEPVESSQTRVAASTEQSSPARSSSLSPASLSPYMSALAQLSACTSRDTYRQTSQLPSLPYATPCLHSGAALTTHLSCSFQDPCISHLRNFGLTDHEKDWC